MQSKRKIAEFATIKHGYAFEGRYFSEMEGEHILLTPGNFHIDQKLYFGKNTKYKASDQHPVLLYYGKFGTEEMRMVEAKFEDDQLFPVRGKS